MNVSPSERFVLIAAKNDFDGSVYGRWLCAHHPKSKVVSVRILKRFVGKVKCQWLFAAQCALPISRIVQVLQTEHRCTIGHILARHAGGCATRSVVAIEFAVLIKLTVVHTRNDK